MKVLWVALSKDKYKLPVAVADSRAELAEMMHTTKNAISSNISRYKRGLGPERYAKVEVPEEKEDIENLISAVDLEIDMNCPVPEKDLRAYQAMDLIRGDIKQRD